jgi:hypothetical protein
MVILLIIILLPFCSWMLFALARRLRRPQVSPGWWLPFGILVVGGAGFGVWCGFFCEYPVGPRFRFGSFPIPAVVFHLEGGDWVDYPLPTIEAWAAAVTDILAITVLATLPIWLASWRVHRPEKTTARCLEFGCSLVLGA